MQNYKTLFGVLISEKAHFTELNTSFVTIVFDGHFCIKHTIFLQFSYFNISHILIWVGYLLSKTLGTISFSILGGVWNICIYIMKYLSDGTQI